MAEITPGVTAQSGKDFKGLWVNDDSRCIGLVEQVGVGGFLAIWKDQSGAHLPLAVTYDGVQLPSVLGDSSTYRFIAWGDLFSCVEAFKAKANPGPPALQ